MQRGAEGGSSPAAAGIARRISCCMRARISRTNLGWRGAWHCRRTTMWWWIAAGAWVVHNMESELMVVSGDHRRFSAVSNGHHSLDRKDGVACIGSESEPVTSKAKERVTSNGALQLAVVPAPEPAVAVKDEGKAGSNGGSGGAKKRRGPGAVLLEGSRCSRVNGRGWRCSQPTLVGYSLCEHHLGKGRMRSAAAAAAAARGRLGRTEHAARTIPAALGAAVVTVAAAVPLPKAEAPSLPPC